MGELLDKLERASRGGAQPLGFGTTAQRERIAPLLLIGLASAGDDAQARLATEAGLDAVIARGDEPRKKTVTALNGLTWGAWLDDPKQDADSGDFQVFSNQNTSVRSLMGEGRSLFMAIGPDMEDGLLRTIDTLPVDGFVLSLDEGPLTIATLMRIGRVRGVTSRWLLLHVGALPDKDEMEHLRDMGINGLVVDLEGKSGEDLKACKNALLAMPREQPERRRRARRIATVPQVQSEQAAPSRPEPEEPDDDDWDSG